MLDAIKMWEMPDYLIVVFFILVVLWEGYRWIREKERAKKLTVHNIAFETKFELYKEIWGTIYKLQSISAITPSLDQLPMDAGEKKKEYERRLEAAYKAFNKAVSVLELKKPFYDKKIYKLARQLSKVCLKHIIGIKNRIEVSESDSKKMSECYEMADALEDDTKDMIEKIEEAIRKETA